MNENALILPFDQLDLTAIAEVGGKNASLGEMHQRLKALGIRVPSGFAITAEAYRMLLEENGIGPSLAGLLEQLDMPSLSNLAETGAACRKLLAGCQLPGAVARALDDALERLDPEGQMAFAIRSSATAEDLPDASFAGQHDSFLNVRGRPAIHRAVLRCYVSLFNDRAIKYRTDHGNDHMQVDLSVGVQEMVRSDIGSSGVAFTIDPETGFEGVIYVTAAWGLGEYVVQGVVNPDEFYLFKTALDSGHRALIRRRLGVKDQKLMLGGDEHHPVVHQETSAWERGHFALSAEEAELLGRWCLAIERHYGRPMDIEWAKCGKSGILYILQARPETVHRPGRPLSVKEYRLKTAASPLCRGKAVGRAIASGPVRIIQSLADGFKVREGDILVAKITNPDWNALLRKAVCIVTDQGGRTSHASIVARELGIHAVVGTGNATSRLHDGQMVTVACTGGDEGQVYAGALEWEESQVDLDPVLPKRVKPMFILADPDRAFLLAGYPVAGVGLLRMEFIISREIRIHPMALIRYEDLPDGSDKAAIQGITSAYPDKAMFFVEQLAGSVAMVAAAFFPREVIVRMSDFKSNEYAQLLGGAWFEPDEENPMIGFRGASRYYHDKYRAGFGLECEAIRMVRDDMGLTNVKVMIPFCRTVEEGQKVLEVMEQYGLKRGQNGLEVYVMVELPANVIRADAFAALFDGFSIGTNDLTQLTLGLDRDSALVSDLFDEEDPAVSDLIIRAIHAAKKRGIPIGLCGQAPSDRPGFVRLLVREGIDSISFTPDALLNGILLMEEAERDFS